jgi:hypothetical protein
MRYDKEAGRFSDCASGNAEKRIKAEEAVRAYLKKCYTLQEKRENCINKKENEKKRRKKTIRKIAF